MPAASAGVEGSNGLITARTGTRCKWSVAKLKMIHVPKSSFPHPNFAAEGLCRPFAYSIPQFDTKTRRFVHKNVPGCETSRFMGFLGVGGQCRTLTSSDSKGLAVVADLPPEKFTTKMEKFVARNVADFGSDGGASKDLRAESFFCATATLAQRAR